MTPGQSFSSVLTPREPNARQSPPSGQIKAAALRASLRRSHDLPSRRTLLLRALGQCSWGDGLMYENAAGLGCVAASLFSPWYFLRRPLWANEGSGSIPKMLRRPKPPSPGGPPKQHRGPAGHTQEAGILPRPAPVPLRPQFLPVTTKKIPCGTSNTFLYCGVTDYSCCFGRKKYPFTVLTLALELVLALDLNRKTAYLILVTWEVTKNGKQYH